MHLTATLAYYASFGKSTKEKIFSRGLTDNGVRASRQKNQTYCIILNAEIAKKYDCFCEIGAKTPREKNLFRVKQSAFNMRDQDKNEQLTKTNIHIQRQIHPISKELQNDSQTT